MGQLAFEHAVMERIQGRKTLYPVFSGGNYDMLRRIREYNPDLFLCWNVRRQRFEVHCLSNLGSSHVCDVPDNRLDARLEDILRKGNIRVRGKEIFAEMDRHNEQIEAGRERQRKNDLAGIAEEMYPYFRQLGWEGL